VTGEATTDIALVAVAVVVGLLVLAVIVLAMRLRALGRAHRQAFAGGDLDVVAVLARHGRHLAELRERIEAADDHVERVRAELRTTFSRLGIVRYDAFEDMGGALSFSAALLDERGDGLVISTINGRSDSRTYLKTVAAGQSEHTLSDEERAAIAAASTERTEGETIARTERTWRRR
jgi:hypothetical protein